MANLMMHNGKPMEITPGCKLTCSKVLTDIVTCGTQTIGNRTLLNVLYFLFRYVMYVLGKMGKILEKHGFFFQKFGGNIFF